MAIKACKFPAAAAIAALDAKAEKDDATDTSTVGMSMLAGQRKLTRQPKGARGTAGAEDAPVAAAEDEEARSGVTGGWLKTACHMDALSVWAATRQQRMNHLEWTHRRAKDDKALHKSASAHCERNHKSNKVRTHRGSSTTLTAGENPLRCPRDNTPSAMRRMDCRSPRQVAASMLPPTLPELRPTANSSCNTRAPRPMMRASSCACCWAAKALAWAAAAWSWRSFAAAAAEDGSDAP
jgi:hypothetical protein